jgi:hypothetical protein
MKTYWLSAYIGSDKAKENIKTWFTPLCDGMTPYKAEILCDIETDREKKIRAFMIGADNRYYKFERTLGSKTFSISRKRVDPK